MPICQVLELNKYKILCQTIQDQGTQGLQKPPYPPAVDGNCEMLHKACEMFHIARGFVREKHADGVNYIHDGYSASYSSAVCAGALRERG
jgi:hypothetical protein